MEIGGPGGISFCLPGNEGKMLKSKSSVIICDKGHLIPKIEGNSTIIAVDNPRFVWIDICNRFFPEEAPIGKNVVIHPDTIIGKNVRIQSGAVIGEAGFGVWRVPNGLKAAPQYGKVIIEDDVLIGANTCIARGALGDTVIGKGTRIDNLVHIAHNVKIGKYCVIVAHAMLGGSSIIDDYCWIGPHAAIRNKIHVGAGALVGTGAVVVKNVAPGVTVAGVPAEVMYGAS